MKLKIYTPAEVFAEVEATEVVAETPEGSFALLERHLDLATALDTGILSYTKDGEEHFVAVSPGILVKRGEEVLVSVRSAAAGELGQLKQAVERMTLDVDEKEKKAEAAVARLEATFVRQFLEFDRG
jgi:F-type H+-transporting ATPase subunit epsilon